MIGLEFGSAWDWFGITFQVSIAAALLGLLAIWNLCLKPLLLRNFYERQGIIFIDNCHVLVGAEPEVTKLHEKNKSHDSLYVKEGMDIIGTIRGGKIQLYTVSPEASESLVRETGHHIDRSTPALYSFGRLSPFAITFVPMAEPYFKERKAALTRGLNDMKRIFQIANNFAYEVINKHNARPESGTVINVRNLLDYWTRETSGEFIWGKKNIDRSVKYFDADNNLTSAPFMTVLNQTFTELRFHSSRFWNRIFFPLAAWPLDREGRRLAYNVRVLREEMAKMMSTPELGTVAERVQRENATHGIPIHMTRDDLVTATIAGLDTIKFSTMSTLWNLLQPENMGWREKVLSEVSALQADSDNLHISLGHCSTLNAVVYESLRREPPGSLINNVATCNFTLQAGLGAYQIRAGTRIVPCIHALHRNRACWGLDALSKMSALNEFDPLRFIEYGDEIVGSPRFMPFGKGPRRCPGQGPGLLLVKTFVSIFLLQNPRCQVFIPKGQAPDQTNFNIMSRATYVIDCGS